MKYLIFIIGLVFLFSTISMAEPDAAPQQVRPVWKYIQEAESIINSQDTDLVKNEKLNNLIVKAGLAYPFFFNPYPAYPYPVDNGGFIAGYLGAASGYNNFLGGLFGNNYPPLFTYYPQNYYGYFYPPSGTPIFPPGQTSAAAQNQ